MTNFLLNFYLLAFVHFHSWVCPLLFMDARHSKSYSLFQTQAMSSSECSECGYQIAHAGLFRSSFSFPPPSPTLLSSKLKKSETMAWKWSQPWTILLCRWGGEGYSFGNCKCPLHVLSIDLIRLLGWIILMYYICKTDLLVLCHCECDMVALWALQVFIDAALLQAQKAFI